ncbi:MAG: hypothetical protein ACJAVV_003297 [Alphaproteobacteria bacterium]
MTYQANVPIEKLAFKSSQDNSRIARWTPIQDDFEILVEQGKEVVRRKDDTSFDKVSFELTPTYVNLPKDYAPFSPFSDGGMLFHSGRFFACASSCPADLNSWEMTLISIDADFIVVDGQNFMGRTSWIDRDDGQKIYLGSATPQENMDIFALIDSKLPPVLLKALERQIPEMMTFFASRLAKLEFKPTLFASYSETSNGSFGHQGGTLPNQVFMHWYGKQAISTINEYQVSWFFAHEIAHIFQREAKNIAAIEQQWIHEGGSEYMSYELLYKLGGNYRIYAEEKFKTSTSLCWKRTKTRNFGALIADQNYDLLYSCGLVFWHIIANDVNTLKVESNVFDIWAAFNSEVMKGEPSDFTTFLKVIEPIVSKETFNTLRNIQKFRAADFVHLGGRAS